MIFIRILNREVMPRGRDLNRQCNKLPVGVFQFLRASCPAAKSVTVCAVRRMQD